MKARRAVGCSTSAALVERFTRGRFSGSLTADPLRNVKNSHGLLVILTVRRPIRAGPRAHRESASGQKRTPIIKYRKNKATCHASPPTGASPHLVRVATGSSPQPHPHASGWGELGRPPDRPRAVRAARHAERRRRRPLPWSGMLRSPTRRCIIWREWSKPAKTRNLLPAAW
jgi:hypothetical protein